MQIFLARNNVQAGPYTLEQLNTMLATGEVLPDDLIWHQGMENWQKVGAVVGDKPYYSPPEQVNTPPSDKLTVDRLYGNNPSAENTSSTADNNLDKQPKSELERKELERKTKIILNKATKSKNPIHNAAPYKAKSANPNEVIVAGNPPVILAPVMTRILALAINSVLYLLAMMPLLLELAKLEIDTKKFENFSDFEAAYQYSMTLMESISNVTIIASQLMMFALFAIQALLIIKRGQSLGKMITGIRVVDAQTHHLPSLGRLFGIRTLLLILIYNLLFSFTPVLGVLVIAVHFFMAAKDTKNIGWHDKLAKTLVVKAEDKQIDKLTT